MSTCIVKDCNTEPDANLTFYKIPRSRILRGIWLNAISSDDELTLDSAVCSRHFNDDDFEVIKNGKRVLRTHAVPRISDANNTQTIDASVATINGEENVASVKEETSTDVQNNTEKVVKTETDKETPLQDTGQVNGCILVEKVVEHVGKECPSNEDRCAKSNQDKEIADLIKQDVEEIITHYHIKQNISKRQHENDTIHNSPNRVQNTEGLSQDLPQNPYKNQNQTFLDIIEWANAGDAVRKLNVSTPTVLTALDLEPSKNSLVAEMKGDNYIQISTNDITADNNRSGSAQDCYMLLEDVQVELDPSNFLHDDEYEVEIEINTETKKDEPISLLTSSDDDDVIIQEPHIDTVEVSDETDSDDMPLVKLVKMQKSKSHRVPEWGMKYCCMDCNFKTIDRAQYKKHTESHTVLQVCDVCDYTTSSKAQFTRHKRKHREEKKFKCHLCGYKARHNMSLLYHLKTHDQGEGLYKCKKCGFRSNVESRVKKHMCFGRVKYYSCVQCEYKTPRRSDLRRHLRRKHPEEDEWVPP